MLYAVEIGNSRTKVTCFSEEGLMLGDTHYFDRLDLSWWPNLGINDVLRIANTSNLQLQQDWERHVISLKDPWPFAFSCSPSIGIDRCLGVLGARMHQPKGSIGVISCGTCMTATLLTEDDRLLGGSISPGWKMRLDAMADYAPSLPRLSAVMAQFSPEGTRNTEESLHQGAYAGMYAEIEKICTVWSTQDANIHIFITGGDGMAFAKPLESGIFAASNLEAHGIFAQYKYGQQR